MAGFKLENNVPNYYVDESRDFQLLCRIIDIYLKGCLNKSSYIPYQLDLDKCDEQLLYAIANMQGFTTKKYIPPNILRNILKVFPYCIKKKGTKEAIELASYAILSTDRLIYYIDIQITSYAESDSLNSYTIRITCNSQSEYLPYLEEVLKFIIPIGWRIEYQLLNTYKKEANTLKIEPKSKISRLSGITGKIINKYPLIVEGIIGDNFSSGDTISDTVYSKIGFAKIILSRDLNSLDNNKGYVNNTEGFIDLINIEKNTTTFIGNNIEVTNPSSDTEAGGN